MFWLTNVAICQIFCLHNPLLQQSNISNICVPEIESLLATFHSVGEIFFPSDLLDATQTGALKCIPLIFRLDARLNIRYFHAQ